MIKANPQPNIENSKFYLTEPEPKLQEPQIINNLIGENSISNQGKEEILKIPFSNGKQVLDLLSQIEEKNLYYIQNTHESEEDLEKKKKVLKELKEKHESVTKENNERIRVLNNSKNVFLKKN